MSRGAWSFLVWFVVLLGFFTVANLSGWVRPMGLKPFQLVGFPYTVYAWGFGIKDSFSWSAVAWNAAIAVTVSAVLALGCAWARSRIRPAPGTKSSEVTLSPEASS